METYKVTATGKEFEKFIKENISSKYQDSLCILIRKDEIYFKTANQDILTLLSLSFPTEVSEPPDTMFEINRGWTFIGNHRLFDL